MVTVAAETVTATDDSTLVVKAHTAKVDTIERLLGLWQCAGCRVVPKEVIDEYGDMKEWQNVAGTGPYRIVDVVPDSTVTLNKNPNYWQNDPDCGAKCIQSRGQSAHDRSSAPCHPSGHQDECGT